MELGFIAHAVRRHLWIVLLGAVLGFGAGSALGAGGTVRYVSEGLLSVEPPPQVSPDRYVATQLVRLTSSGVTQSVAARPSVSLPPSETRRALSLAQIPGTDVVRVSASTASPELSQAIAQGYMDAYLDALRVEQEEALEPQRTELQASLDAVASDLAEVDAQAEALTAPYLMDRNVGIPSLEQLDPALATQRTALTEQYQRLLTAQAEFNRSADGMISSRMLEAPGLPTEPVTSEKPLYRVIGLVLGLLLGVAAATVIARLSPLVVDRREAEEILGTGFVGTIGRRRSLGVPLDRILFGPALNEEAVRQLCIRAQAHVPEGAPLSVLVAGSQHAAGTSTVAALVAQHFAYEGRSVLIVDADVTAPDLSRQVPASDITSNQALIETGTIGTDRSEVSWDRRRGGDEITVAGFPFVEDRPAHLVGVSALVTGALLRAETVVVDGGFLMGSASTVQFSRECDVVILAVPVSRQRADELYVIKEQLAHSGCVVLPVVTPALKRRKTDPAVQETSEFDDASEMDEPAGAVR